MFGRNAFIVGIMFAIFQFSAALAQGTAPAAPNQGAATAVLGCDYTEHRGGGADMKKHAAEGEKVPSKVYGMQVCRNGKLVKSE
jgi:hypothetical protein